MSQMRFVLDEHVPVALQSAVWRLEPAIDVVCVGRDGAPVKGTPDAELLAWAEGESRALLTDDRTTMPLHVADHVARGRNTWGVFLLRRQFSLGEFAATMLLCWTASEAEEWKNYLGYLP